MLGSPILGNPQIQNPEGRLLLDERAASVSGERAALRFRVLGVLGFRVLFIRVLGFRVCFIRVLSLFVFFLGFWGLEFRAPGLGSVSLEKHRVKKPKARDSDT